jgi:hypothetical protein
VKKVPNYKLRTRPPLYNDPSELLDYFYQYILNSIDEQRLPTKEGMTVHCFNARSQRNKYEHIDNFKYAFEEIYDVLADETVNSKHVDPQTKKIVLQSKYNYAEKVTAEIRKEEDLTDEERESKIRELLQKLNINSQNNE